VAQQPPLSPIAEVVQADVFVESVESSRPPTGYIPRVSFNPAETVVENVQVVPAQIQQEPDFLPQPGFVARIVENIEVAAASISSQAPAPKSYYPRLGLVEDIEVISEASPVQNVNQSGYTPGNVVVESIVDKYRIPNTELLMPGT